MVVVVVVVIIIVVGEAEEDKGRSVGSRPLLVVCGVGTRWGCEGEEGFERLNYRRRNFGFLMERARI